MTDAFPFAVLALSAVFFVVDDARDPRAMGLLLAAIAVEFVASGVRDLFPALAAVS